MAVERAGAILWKGAPQTLLGPELKVGDAAPEANLIANDLSSVKLLESTAGKVRLVSVLLSVGTGICDNQTKKFDAEVANVPNAVAVTISMDLPFNQKQYCGGAGTKHTLLSDHKYGEFGKLYGILVKELRMHGRAVFVIGSDNKVAYAGYNKEIAEAPNHDAALAALKAAK